jgi:putative transposase
VMVEFIDAHREAFGVEPICRVLAIAPSTYYSTTSRPPSSAEIPFIVARRFASMDDMS